MGGGLQGSIRSSLPSPSPALSSFPSLGRKRLLDFYLLSISMKRLLIPYCTLQLLWWGSPLGLKPSEMELAVFPGLPAPQQGCCTPQNILNFLWCETTSANLPVGGMFIQIRHPQLCLSLVAFHCNTALCLAQKRKSGSSQKPMLWWRKISGISNMTNFI